MKIKDLPKIELPREKLEKYGPEKLSNSELLAILLRSGTEEANVIELSRHILKKFQYPNITEASLKDLKQIHGLGTAKACEIIACFELGRRLLQNKKATLLLSPEDVWRELADIREHRKEHFVVFFLDARNQVTRRELVSMGTLNASIVHPREVFEPAIKYNAAQVIVAHNHPSGDTTPSTEDMEVTSRLQVAGNILGIELLDHVIVTKNSYKSILR